MKKLIVVFLVVLMLALAPAAIAIEADAAAQLATLEVTPIVDKRVGQLEAYLESHNSPLADKAEVFVREADKHKLDWKFVAAIAGTESTFGKHIPPGSYNAWGWGIPTGARSGIGFDTWEHGIATVSEGLATRYYGRGAKTVYDVGWIYAANGISWGNHVTFFLNKIDSFVPIGAEYLEVSI